MTNLPTIDAIALDTVHGGTPTAPAHPLPAPPRSVRPAPHPAPRPVPPPAPRPMPQPVPVPMNRTDLRMHPHIALGPLQIDLPIEIHTERVDHR